MISKLGYAQTVTMMDTFSDILSAKEAAKDDNSDVGEGSLAYLSPEEAQMPKQTSADVRVPSLWLERTTGSLLLTPLLFLDTCCCFTADVKWRAGLSGESESPDDSNLLGNGTDAFAGQTAPEHPVNDWMGSGTITQRSQIYNAWRPLVYGELTDYFREVSIPESTVASSGKKLMRLLSPDTAKLYMEPWEHYIQSEFILEASAAFAIRIEARSPTKFLLPSVPGGTAPGPSAAPAYVRVYWGKNHAMQWNGHTKKLQYSYSAEGNNSGAKEWQDMDLPIPVGSMGARFTVVVQVVNNAIVFSLAGSESPAAKDRPEYQINQNSWVYRFKGKKAVRKMNQTSGDELVEAAPMLFGFNGLGCSVAYIPVYYVPYGYMTSRTIETGTNLSGVQETHDARTVNDAREVDVAFEVTDQTKFDFTVTLTRPDHWGMDQNTIINRSPIVYAVKLKSSPTYDDVECKSLELWGKIRSVSLRHGIFDQSGTVVVDNSDGILKDTVAILPVKIYAGWYMKNGALNPVSETLRFAGFSTNITVDKKAAPYSTATITLEGRSMQFKDAIAVNLPIYDGYLHIDAIEDLVQRGGWYVGNANTEPIGQPFFTDPFYRLTVPAMGEAPRYMFAMGTPIWQCIEEIGRATGYWMYVDSKGVFNYVPPFKDTPVRTYREVPSAVGSYDEWMSLSVLKDTADIRNAVLVIGLPVALTDKSQPLVGLITPVPPYSVGDGDPSTGTMRLFCPWNRWIMVGDAKLGDQGVVDAVARRLHDNNNRPRWTLTGRVWGKEDVFPLSTIALDLKTDQMGVTQGGFQQANEWRVTDISETFDGEKKEWFMDLTCEWIDPRYSYASWWGRD
jgi:hypothetical protein